ncbi:MAG: glycosyltransferase, partial [Bacteroidota bacterium]
GDEVRKQCAPHGEKVIVHTSNFRPVKRVVDVIRIFAEIRKRLPARLLLIGDGPERSQCELLARELGIHDDVKFLGKQTELVPILSSADLFLMPSQSESFGLSALEAMACEVPVISSSVGGLPELVVHGQTGFIAEMGDIDRMSRYAIDLLTNPSKHQLFAKASRQKAMEFNSNKIIAQYEQYYEKILYSSEVPAK